MHGDDTNLNTKKVSGICKIRTCKLTKIELSSSFCRDEVPPISFDGLSNSMLIHLTRKYYYLRRINLFRHITWKVKPLRVFSRIISYCCIWSYHTATGKKIISVFCIIASAEKQSNFTQDTHPLSTRTTERSSQFAKLQIQISV